MGELLKLGRILRCRLNVVVGVGSRGEGQSSVDNDNVRGLLCD